MTCCEEIPGCQGLVLASEAGRVREAGEVQGVEGMEELDLTCSLHFVTICTHTHIYISICTITKASR